MQSIKTISESISKVSFRVLPPSDFPVSTKTVSPGEITSASPEKFSKCKLIVWERSLSRVCIVFLCLFIFCNKLSFAAPDLTYERKVFPSGFVLITHEDFTHPVVSVRLVIRAGSIYEEIRTNGIAHYYEHVFFKGTPSRNAYQMKSEIEAIGGEMNGTTYKDFTEFYINAPSSFTREAIDFLLDAMLNATLNQDDVEKERKVVIEEITLNRQNPHRMMLDLLYENLYLEHPYRKPVGGSPQSVSRISRDDLKEFKARYYNPANAALVVVGAINAKEIETQVLELIGKLPMRQLDLPSMGQESAKLKPKQKLQYEDVERAYLSIGYLVCSMDAPEEIYPLDLLTFILGQGKGSRLDRILKNEKGLVNEITANYQTVRYQGALEIIAILDPDKVDGTREAILAEIERLKRGDISNNELERAKRLLEGTYTMGHETMSGKGGTLAHYEGHGKISFVKNYLSNINKVAVSDIVRIANKYLKDNYTEVLIVPKKEEKKEEKKQ